MTMSNRDTTRWCSGWRWCMIYNRMNDWLLGPSLRHNCNAAGRSSMSMTYWNARTFLMVYTLPLMGHNDWLHVLAHDSANRNSWTCVHYRNRSSWNEYPESINNWVIPSSRLIF